MYLNADKEDSDQSLRVRVHLVLFVCVEVLQPSQPNGVMSSAVSLPNHTFTWQAGSFGTHERRYFFSDEVIKLFSCSTQLSMKYVLLIQRKSKITNNCNHFLAKHTRA